MSARLLILVAVDSVLLIAGFVFVYAGLNVPLGAIEPNPMFDDPAAAMGAIMVAFGLALELGALAAIGSLRS